jgi:hypothetical protein
VPNSPSLGFSYVDDAGGVQLADGPAHSAAMQASQALESRQAHRAWSSDSMTMELGQQRQEDALTAMDPGICGEFVKHWPRDSTNPCVSWIAHRLRFLVAGFA